MAHRVALVFFVTQFDTAAWSQELLSPVMYPSPTMADASPSICQCLTLEGAQGYSVGRPGVSAHQRDGARGARHGLQGRLTRDQLRLPTDDGLVHPPDRERGQGGDVLRRGGRGTTALDCARDGGKPIAKRPREAAAADEASGNGAAPDDAEAADEGEAARPRKRKPGPVWAPRKLANRKAARRAEECPCLIYIRSY